MDIIKGILLGSLICILFLLSFSLLFSSMSRFIVLINKKREYTIKLEIEKQNTIKAQEGAKIKEYEKLKTKLQADYEEKEKRIKEEYAQKIEARYKDYLEQETFLKNYFDNQIKAANILLHQQKEAFKKEYVEKEKELSVLKSLHLKEVEAQERTFKKKLQTLEQEYLLKKQELEQLKNDHQKKYLTQINEFKDDRQHFHIKETYLNQNKKIYETGMNFVKNLIDNQCQAYPALAAVMADILTVHYTQSAKLLEKKKRPALEEAKRIRELQAETKSILEEKKTLEYKLAYIRSVFPNIDEIFETDFNINNFKLEIKE